MTDEKPVAQYSSHAWIGLFAGRLLQLRPDMRVGYAVRCAVANYHQAFDQEPGDAAASFAHSDTVSAANQADPGLQHAAPASMRYRVAFRRA